MRSKAGSEARVAVNGIELCYESFGDPRDPAMILIMGLAAQMIVWSDEFCLQLAAQGRFVVRFDNRDIGRSTALEGARAPSMAVVLATHALGIPQSAPYTLLDMARDTVGLMDALSIESADIVGASMGGAIAQEMALHVPARLRTMTLIMSPTGDPRSPQPTARVLTNMMRPRGHGREAFLRAYVEVWRALAGDGLPFDEDATLLEGARAYDRGVNPPGVVRQMLAIIASGNRTPKLRSVTTPTLVIHGSEDPLVRLEIGRDLAAAIRGARFVVVNGMGHNLPREAWPQILEALRTHAPPAS